MTQTMIPKVIFFVYISLDMRPWSWLHCPYVCKMTATAVVTNPLRFISNRENTVYPSTCGKSIIEFHWLSWDYMNIPDQSLPPEECNVLIDWRLAHLLCSGAGERAPLKAKSWKRKRGIFWKKIRELLARERKMFARKQVIDVSLQWINKQWWMAI